MHASGWVKLHRSMLDWEWIDSDVMVRSFIIILLKANHQPFRWHGIDFSEGQFVTSYDHLAHDLRLTVKQTRLVVKKLVQSGEITWQGHTKYSVVTIANWKEYQMDIQQGKDNSLSINDLIENEGKQTDIQRANKGQTKGNSIRMIRSKEYKEEYKEESSLFPTSFSFDEFWNTYDKKVDRAKCESIYSKVKEDDRVKIKAALPDYVRSTPEVQYRKNPQTWLNGKCWNDDIPVDKNHNGTIWSKEDLADVGDVF